MRVAFVYMNNELGVGRGAGYVASAVTSAGHELSFFDSYFTPIKIIAKKVARGRYDILLISSMTMIFPEALKLINLVKNGANIPVLVGGVHATIMGEQLLLKHPTIDYLCIGEGESMIVEFLRDFGTEKMFDVENLAYRRDGKIFSNPIRPPEDLSKLPQFKWDLFQDQAVLQKPSESINLDATRGCPFSCTYCCNKIYLDHYGKSYIRFKPIPRVIEEMKFLNERYHPKFFYFGDEMTLSNPEYAIQLFRAIKRYLDVPFGCMVRAEYITPSIVDELCRNGCQYVGIGVECGDEDFRKEYLNRRMTNEQIEKAFALLKKAGIFVTSFNMIGYPYRNDEALTKATVELNRRISPDYVQVSIFYPFPGTKLYEYCVERNLIDQAKLDRTRDYFSESVLKDVSLARKRVEIDLHFNPLGMQFMARKEIDRTARQNLTAIRKLRNAGLLLWRTTKAKGETTLLVNTT